MPTRRIGHLRKEKKFRFPWIYKDLAFLGKKARVRVLRAELEEIKAEEKEIKKILKNL